MRTQCGLLVFVALAGPAVSVIAGCTPKSQTASGLVPDVPVALLSLSERVRVADARTPEANPGAANSAHLEVPCRAVDLRVHTAAERFRVISAALTHGIVRVGVYPPTEHQRTTYGPASGSVHLDASPTKPQAVMWMTW